MGGDPDEREETVSVVETVCCYHSELKGVGMFLFSM